ncbi:DNA helicase/exodeoxyribonuclease V subunit B [Melghiribacillus thermohalophilus]|uniref:ATP-dependent helicase/deoxyribonuclease subunit B n=1 Tax=Melghiribacillus thermohalophilus TaxID=1324956 RepID=A0A4R3MTR4_9BACI|nr:helicase-exonuclease AddAB subunit AddB [Melghiribacillus thermohalophilus]TCT16696.1 DNA helicase/exodeoxyribonuclease V subunit B [Melghiribacillus thermohalophilus]
MALRFVIGRSGTDKSKFCLGEMERKLLDNPHGKPIIYLVPDQMTFQEEYELLRRGIINGSTRAHIFSFSRLAWRVFQETGGGVKKFISSTGIQMMLRKITEENKSDWQVFQKAIEKQGFMEKIEGMITEFKRYRITPEQLFELIDQMDAFRHKYQGEKTLQHKLKELASIYEQLTDALREHYIDSEDQLALLGEKIKKADFLDGADIYVNGFHRLTPQELFVVEALLKKAGRMTVTLTLDVVPEEEINDLDLFYQTKQTYLELRNMADASQVPIETMTVLHPEKEQLKGKPYFVHLEKHFDRHPVVPYEKNAPIVIREAVHPRAEVEGVAQEILRLVRDEQYRYRDIAVYIRQSEVYHELIQTIFEDYQIPVFVDEKRTMLNHPLIELIRSGLDAVESNWRYDAVFRLLKTDFIPSFDRLHPLSQDGIDELENYVLEFGIRSRSQWLSEEPWVYQRFRGFDVRKKTTKEIEKEERINRLRLQVTEALADFDRNIRSAKTVYEKCEAIYMWLEQLNVPSTLETWRDQYDENGQIERAREQEQVWDAVIQLLDEMVEMIGDEQVALSVFRQMLETGFESLQFAHVPPSMDHVIVATVDRSRTSSVQCAFLLGVNEGIWPLKPASESVISEEERELLTEHGVKLADSSTRKLLDDRFYVYLAFTSPSDYLWVSYTLADEEGNSRTPSPYIGRLKEMFPGADFHTLLEDEDEDDPLRFVSVPEKTRSVLTSQLARYLRGYPVHDAYWDALNWFLLDESRQAETKRIFMSLFYENKPKQLSKNTAEQIYPKQLKTSVSRLETFYRCQYQHFARYTLNLEERPVYKLDAPDIGQLFHEALKQITDWLFQEGRSFKELSKEEAEQYARKATNELSPILQHQILFSSNRYQYILQKLEQVVIRAAKILTDQAKRSEFTPAGVEVGFGPGQKLPPMVLPLKDGYELVLRGRIDRVDRADVNDQLFLRIIDYKSSRKDLSLTEVYYGLALQMLAYLDVILNHAEKWLGRGANPAGVLYFHVHNPMISDPESFSIEDIEKEMFKRFKMKGLLLEDEDIVKRMDTELDSGYSPVIPAGLKKNGGFYKRGSNTIDGSLLKGLQHYVRSLMKEAGISIVEGKIGLDPYKMKNQMACTYCSFRSLCQFDPTLEDNHFRILKDLRDEEVFSRLTGEKGDERE